MRVRMVATLACLLLVSVPAVADTVYSNGGPDNRNGGQSDSDIPQWWAADFSLSSASQVSGIRFWGGYYRQASAPPAADNFTLKLFGDSSSLPDSGDLIATIALGDPGRTDTGEVFNPLSTSDAVYRYEATFAPLTLAAGTTYWVAIFNSTPTISENWIWATSANSGHIAHSENSGSTWTVHTADELAFEFTNGPAGAVVPLPPTILLCGAGMLVAALARRRRRRS